MALPKINDVPLYSVTIPSSGKVVKFRPFLVKEQKVLMIAFETQDQVQLINAMLDTIHSCCEDLDTNVLTKVDIDYLFAHIRAKSVGEIVNLVSTCQKCQSDLEFKFDITELKIPEIKHRTRTVELTPELYVKLRVPGYHDILNNNAFGENVTTQEMLTRMILSCIESVQTGEENILMKDEPYEEKANFIDFLTIDQFEKLNQFILEIPSISYNVSTTCEKCGSKEERVVEGIDNFF